MRERNWKTELIHKQWLSETELVEYNHTNDISCTFKTCLFKLSTQLFWLYANIMKFSDKINTRLSPLAWILRNLQLHNVKLIAKQTNRLSINLSLVNRTVLGFTIWNCVTLTNWYFKKLNALEWRNARNFLPKTGN